MVESAAVRTVAEGRPNASAMGRVALLAVATRLFAVDPAVAHSGHAAGHGGGGSIVVPGGILLGSLLVIGAGAYLDHTDSVDGRLARLAVLFGVGGVLLGILAAV
jgi:hypothetical protein